MRRLFAIACALAGCYDARAFPGAPCTAEGACPSGLACVAGLCELPGTAGDELDAATTASRDAAADASPDAPPDAEGPAGPNGWHAATRVPGVNTTSTETDPCFANSDLTIVFASDRAGGSGGVDLYIGTRAATTQAFTVRELRELNSTADDESPELSADGLTIYFATTRAGTAQIFSAARASTTEVFSTPTQNAQMSTSHTGLTNAVSVGVGSPEVAIVVFDKGASNEADGYDYGSGAWSDDEDLNKDSGGPLPGDFTAPSMTPDLSTIYYQSGSAAQIFSVSYDGSFGAPVNISELDVGARDASPEISADGTHLVFERDGDLYEATK